jgi:Glycosyl transferases group 1
VSHVGIDLEQFVTDPYGSGIQRVLQHLALQWPQERCAADFIVPWRGQSLILSPQQAADLIGLAFAPRGGATIREAVDSAIAQYADSAPCVHPGQLLSMYSSWLLPEVSYLPSVLQRFGRFQTVMPAVMIGYDTLPMTEPSNYRFRPGASAWVSEYFRCLARADSVVCISAFARDSILRDLRRDRILPISVAHPGGDHGDVILPESLKPRDPAPVRIVRLGTLEARKRPVEIARAFAEAVRLGAKMELTFVGARSASDQAINDEITTLTEAGIGMHWVRDADDAEVARHMADADLFLSIGTEGYGIPVLEAIVLGTPVLFDGVQPAAELMEGRGARRINGMVHSDLVEAFLKYDDPVQIAALRREISVEALPTWRQFADGVCSGVLGA